MPYPAPPKFYLFPEGAHVTELATSPVIFYRIAYSGCSHMHHGGHCRIITGVTIQIDPHFIVQPGHAKTRLSTPPRATKPPRLHPSNTTSIIICQYIGLLGSRLDRNSTLGEGLHRRTRVKRGFPGARITPILRTKEHELLCRLAYTGDPTELFSMIPHLPLPFRRSKRVLDTAQTLNSSRHIKEQRGIS
jgi:hypothetical protein